MLKDVKNMSERMECRVVGLSRSVYRSLPLAQTPADPDAALREQLRGYARKNPRHGFRRAWAHLRFDDGIEINKKKVHRLWKEEGRQVRRAPRRKRAGQSSVPVIAADAPKVVWALDFQFDSTVDGKKIKIASMVDEHTRMSLLNIVDRSIPAERLIEELEKTFAIWGGPPMVLRMDNGPEFISEALQGFCAGSVGGDLLHSARHTVEQRVHRVVQQPTTRRVPEPQLLADPARGPGGDRRLQRRPQPPAPALGVGLPDPRRVRCPMHPPAPPRGLRDRLTDSK